LCGHWSGLGAVFLSTDSALFRAFGPARRIYRSGLVADRAHNYPGATGIYRPVWHDDSRLDCRRANSALGWEDLRIGFGVVRWAAVPAARPGCCAWPFMVQLPGRISP